MRHGEWTLTDMGPHYSGPRYTIETLIQHPTDTSRVASCTVATCYQKEFAEQIIREHALEEQFARPAAAAKSLADLGLSGISDHIFQFIISHGGCCSRPAAYAAAYMGSLAVRAQILGECFRLTETAPVLPRPAEERCGCDGESRCSRHDGGGA